MAADQYEINEAACWDPKTETLTLTIDGEEVTQTWQAWSQCMVGSGAYASAAEAVHDIIILCVVFRLIRHHGT